MGGERKTEMVREGWRERDGGRRSRGESDGGRRGRRGKRESGGRRREKRESERQRNNAITETVRCTGYIAKRADTETYVVYGWLYWALLWW